MATVTTTSTTTAGDKGGDDGDEYVQLKLASGNGPVYRAVKRTPLRDALESEIPIVDVSGIFSPSLADRLAVAARVRAAATNNGFFYVSHHGIPARVTAAAEAACLAFFRQPLDAKMPAHTRHSRYFNGYKPPRTQRINPAESVDVRESFSWTYDPRYDPAVADVAGIPASMAQFMRMEEFQWDATARVAGFKDAIVEYWVACLGLARALVRTFALSLGLEEGYFDEKFRYPDASLGLNYYPPINAAGGGGKEEAGQEEGEEVSIGSHTDFQLFTILYQDSAGGLQVLDRSGQWLRAAPIEGTFVVNIADYLQRITNDRYVSTVHRAVNHSGRERVSMPFFFGFGLHESCGVLDSCLEAGEEKKYDEIGCAEWVRRRVGEMYSGKEKTDQEETGR